MQKENSTCHNKYTQTIDHSSTSDQTIKKEESKSKTKVQSNDQSSASISQVANENKPKHKTEVQSCMAQPIEITPSVLNICQNQHSHSARYSYVSQSLMYEYLHEYSREYDEIASIFEDCGLTVLTIRKVHNPYLRKAFELKRHFHYDDIIPRRLYHGTKRMYVDSICNFNFDWRLSGRETGHMFGKGVNFTRRPWFATYFGERHEEKVIIIAYVLVRSVTRGSEDMTVPPRGYDTAEGKQGTVVVKFYDNEFYPTHVVDFIR